MNGRWWGWCLNNFGLAGEIGSLADNLLINGSILHGSATKAKFGRKYFRMADE